MDGLADWYVLGVVLGLGVSAGIAASRRGWLLGLVAVALTFAAAVLAAAVVLVWLVLGYVAGLAVGFASFRRLSAEAVPAAVLGAATLAFVPALGYLEALAAPLIGRRLSRRAGERYAGLRILAKD